MDLPNPPKLKIAFISEDHGHLTGGRYYNYFLCMALVELGFDVTLYTNKPAVFIDSFRKYKLPEIKIVCEEAKQLERLDIEADIYVGSPISGNIAAAKLGEKYNKPAYAIIFDPHNMMAEYLGERTYVSWIPLIKLLQETNTKIISLCNTTSKYIESWLHKRPDQIFSVYPCINSKELTPWEKPTDEQGYVIFISRLVPHKNFSHVLKAVRHLGLKLKVVSSVDDVNAVRLAKQWGMRKDVEFYFNVSDEEKFNLISHADAMINGAIFEGFGMWMAEAITYGKPVVCYDYPTFREIQEFSRVDNVYYANWNDYKDLKMQLFTAVNERKFLPPNTSFYFERLVERMRQLFDVEPKIGVVMIALNEEEYISRSLHAVMKHPNIKKIAVVEGAVNLNNHAANENGLSTDSTSNQILRMCRDQNGDKIVYDRHGWATDKSELRNRCLQLLPKDITHVLVVDADEIWKQEDLDNLVESIKQNPTTGVFMFKFYHFWKSKDMVATGGQWDAQLFRCFKYTNKDLRWSLHEAPVVNKEGKFITATDGMCELDNVHVYHYGYYKSKKNVTDKIEYYKKRDKHLKVKDTWSQWEPGMPTSPTHDNGFASTFTGTHPEEFEKGFI